MGRKKIKIKPIEDKKLRQITYCKRKKGLLKKTMELSLLCKTQVFLAFVDHHNNLAIYNSEGHIANFVDKYLKFPVNPKETYCNQDYQIIFEDEEKMMYGSNTRFQRQLESDADEELKSNTVSYKKAIQSPNENRPSPITKGFKDGKRNKKRKFIRKMQTIGSRFAFKDKYHEPSQSAMYIHNTVNNNNSSGNNNNNNNNNCIGKDIKSNSMIFRNNNIDNCNNIINEDNDETLDIDIDFDDDNDNDNDNQETNLNNNNTNNTNNNHNNNKTSNFNKLQNKLNLKVTIPNDEGKNNPMSIMKSSKFIQALKPQRKHQIHQQLQQHQSLYAIKPMHLSQSPDIKVSINQRYMSGFNPNRFKSPSSINQTKSNPQFEIPMNDNNDIQIKEISQYGNKVCSFKEILHTLSPSTIRDQEEKYNWLEAPYSIPNLNQKRSRDDTSNSLSPRQSNLKTQFYQPQGFNSFNTPGTLNLVDRKTNPNQFNDNFSYESFMNVVEKPPLNRTINTSIINSNGSNMNTFMNSKNNSYSKNEIGQTMTPMKGNFYRWLNSTK